MSDNNELKRGAKSPSLHDVGCGRPKAAPEQVVSKICADCDSRLSVKQKELVCPNCGGPLG